MLMADVVLQAASERIFDGLALRCSRRASPRPYRIVQRRLAGCGGLLSVACARFVDDGGADEVAPFGPGAVVVAHLVEARRYLRTNQVCELRSPMRQ